MKIELVGGLSVLGLALLLGGLMYNTKQQEQRYEHMNAMRANPDNFRFPTCTSPSGYGLIRSMRDYSMYLVEPGMKLRRINGDWRLYRHKLPSMTCDEQ